MQVLKTGDVILSKNPFYWYKPMSYVGAIIRLILGFNYNHVAIYISIYGADFVAEASTKGVNIMPLKEWVKDKEIEIHRNPNLTGFTGRRVMQYQGYTGYDYLSLVWYQLRYQITGKWKGEKGENAKGKLYCSEYYALVDKESFPNWWSVTPKDIYEKGFNLIYKGEAKDLKSNLS